MGVTTLVRGGGCRECERLSEENRVLREENRVLKERLDLLESSVVRAGWYKPSVKPVEEKKKPGRKEGHVGAGRRKPDYVDESVVVKLERCPGCGGTLEEPYSVRSRYVWDVPPPTTIKVTEYMIHRYWCPCCSRSVEAQPDTLPYFRLGMGVWGWAYVLHHQLNVSFDKIAWWMREVWNLPVTKGALTQGLDSLAEHLKPVYDGMIQDLRDNPYVNTDETGCRVNGVNQWTWVFHTPNQTVYWTDPSRGSQVPERILGEHYSGTVVSDDYVAYSPLKYTKQACWVHLIRKIRDYAEMKKAHPEQKRLHHRLQKTYHDLKEYLKKNPATYGAETPLPPV